jgi:surface antigen
MRFAGSVTLLVLLSACAQPPQRSQREPFFSPAAIEAIGSGFVARRFPGLDGIDRRRAAETIVASLQNGRPGQPNPWRNPDSGASGETIPGGPAGIAGRTGCRSFTHMATARGGQTATAQARACPDGRGGWSVVE